jgi:hypothetical protein
VTRDRERSSWKTTLGVRNPGTETVDGWRLSFLAPYTILMDGRFTYYIQSVGAEELVPFAPLLPQPAARHEFFRLPGSRPLAAGAAEEFGFPIRESLIAHQPTLEWARSLPRPAR